MPLWKQYTDEVYKERRYWATWEPGVYLELGSCGPVKNRVFKPQGHLRDYGIQFGVTDDPNPKDTDYSSTNGLEIMLKAAGEASAVPELPQGKAGIAITFTRTEAVVLAAKGARQPRIADQERLKRDLVQSVHQDDGIPERWFVVSDLVTCDYVSVIVARGRSASFVVTGEADFTAGIVDIANAQLNVAIRKESNVGYKLLAKNGATPLFRGLRLKRGFFGDPRVESLGPDEVDKKSDDEIAAAFEELTPQTADATD